jgi:hypothetical protein
MLSEMLKLQRARFKPTLHIASIRRYLIRIVLPPEISSLKTQTYFSPLPKRFHSHRKPALLNQYASWPHSDCYCLAWSSGVGRGRAASTPHLPTMLSRWPGHTELRITVSCWQALIYKHRRTWVCEVEVTEELCVLNILYLKKSK